jgi:hypothetical protein
MRLTKRQMAIQFRDLALLVLGFFGFLRPPEVAGLRVGDFDIVRPAWAEKFRGC